MGFEWPQRRPLTNQMHYASTELDSMLGMPEDFKAVPHQEGEEESHLRVKLYNSGATWH